MYAGPNYAGGRALGTNELPTAQDWQVRPIGFLDDVTRNHDINYTYIEKVYQGNDPASQSERNLALWQADKEMLGSMLSYQPANWLEAQYSDAVIKAFVAKALVDQQPALPIQPKRMVPLKPGQRNHAYFDFHCDDREPGLKRQALPSFI
ncbi:MAG: hypothetical protein R3E56_07945 [Burkholderiaceae bacterium]